MAEVASAPSFPSAPGFDPVRLRFIDALARRAAQVDGPARSLLDARLNEARAAYARDFEAARGAAAAALLEEQRRFPAEAAVLQHHFAQGRFVEMQRLAQTLAARDDSQPLASLLRHIDRPQPGAPGADRATGPATSTMPAAPAELRAVRRARSTWTRLRVEGQIAQSLARLPDNPGPLNSHRLVLRCLQRLQALSPAYVSHLLAQLDTLVWLEQAAPASPREGRGRNRA